MLIESMRDIGYSLETALADIIDNSITSNASHIDILVPPVDTEPRLGVVDNGVGMTEDELLNAMRPGSQNPLDGRNATDLGRFGLGLKTASFSQCRKLTVVTRQNGVTSAAIWDLDYVTKKNKWLVQIPEDITSIPWVDRLKKRGTLVIWECLDRAVGPGKIQENLTQRINDVCGHLELVFHRFLSKERGKRSITIKINERPLNPFDPFHSSHPATIPISTQGLFLLLPRIFAILSSTSALSFGSPNVLQIASWRASSPSGNRSRRLFTGSVDLEVLGQGEYERMKS